MGALSSIRVDPSIYLNLTDWTENKCSKGSYSECTVCGKLPAVLEVDRDEERYMAVIPARWRIHFDPGERLCGYCLVKRCAAIKFDVAVEALLGKVGDVRPPEFISTSDVALHPFKEQLSNMLKKVSEGKMDKGKVMESVRKCVDAAVKEIADSKEKALEIQNISTRYQRFFNEKGDFADKELLDEVALLYAFPSDILLRKIRRELQSVERAIQGLGGGELTVYYAIVMADADNMGDLTFGRASALFKDEGKELAEVFAQYFSQLISESSLASKVKEAFTAVAKEKGDEAKKKIEDILKTLRGTSVTSKDVDEVYSTFRMILDEEGIILSPAYHVALSRALMIAALKDKEEVEKLNGVTIYAGGDDLLAVLPVKNGLKLASETRKAFEGDREEGINGFHVWEQGLIPALSSTGKSYTVLFTHYMHPLYSALRIAHEYMEENSKKAEWKEQDSLKFVKDSCTVVFLPRGAGEGRKAILPLQFKDYGWTLDEAEKIAESVIIGDASHSLLYDLLNEDTINAITWLSSNNQKAASLLIKRIVKRNTIKEQKTEPIISTLTATLNLTFKKKGRGKQLTGKPLAIMILLSALYYLNARFRW